MSKPLPGKGLLGWLGRQVGYVTKAVQSDPGRKVIYRSDKVEEAPHPEEPGVKLRRTVIDEVIVEPKRKMTNDETRMTNQEGKCEIRSQNDESNGKPE